jgi:hypothetical protein
MFDLEQGFYDSGEKSSSTSFKPAGETSLKLAGPFQMTFSSEVNSEPLLLIHLLPVEQSTAGSIPRLLYEFLSPFFTNNTLHIDEINYCLSDENEAIEHVKKIVNLVETKR